jgi:hypothetical protein
MSSDTQNPRTSRSRILSAIVLAASLLVVAPAVTGCGTIADAIEGATGGDVDLGGTSVPDDFPSEVPLIDGEVVAGGAIGNADGKIWNVTVKVPDVSAFDEITADFESAGFESTEVTSGEQGASATFTKDPYGVLVVVAGGDTTQGWVANYTVTQNSSGQ